jgi:membrane protease YdiL (CAAX protease family)
MLLITGDTLFEETGWRGFALPEFSARRSRLTNSLILGVLLAGWHLPIALSESTAVVPYLVATITSAVVTNFVATMDARRPDAWIYHTSANTVGQFFLPVFSSRISDLLLGPRGSERRGGGGDRLGDGSRFGLPRRTATID